MTKTIASSGLLCALVLLTACGEGLPPPNPRPDGGDPDSAALTGALTLKQGAPADGTVRLALAWYPGLLADDGQFSEPGAIHTQDVAYSGTFPQDFRFKLDAEPPEAARVAVDGLEGKAAIGILLAYRDGNGNGTLDTIPADGTPVDHVVGASLRWDVAPAYAVLFVEQAQPDVDGLKKGFNLLRLNGAESSELVPLSTRMAVELTEGGAELDTFICDAAWVGEGTCGLRFEDEQQPKAFLVHGVVGLEDGLVKVNLDVGVDGVYSVDARVELNGFEIPFDDAHHGYYAELDASLIATAEPLTVVVTDEADVHLREVTLPGAFALTAPEVAIVGEDLTIGWTKAYAAQGYRAFLQPVDGAIRGESLGTEARSYTFPALDAPATVEVTVIAVTQNLDGDERQRIDGLRVEKRGFEVLGPAEENP